MTSDRASRVTPLFEAIRTACSAEAWSRGIELTRADAVVGERFEDDEAVFVVRTRGGMICPRVTLFTDDLDWECECSERGGACAHVAAAVIAWRRSLERGAARPAPRGSVGRVAYRFERDGGHLALQRFIVLADGEARPLATTLAAVAAGRVGGPRFAATQPDLAAELALGTHRRGRLPPVVIERLFAAVAQCPEVTLDGENVLVSPEAALPRAHLEEQGDGFRLWVDLAPGVSERFANGVVRCGDTLRPLGTTRLTGRELEDLPRGKSYGSEAIAELVTEVLPSLRERIDVEVRTDRLPRTIAERPRVSFDVEREGRKLTVLATLVYGDPPAARIDGGRLVHLRGDVPMRDEPAERRLTDRLRRELQLVPGVRAELEGAEAVRLCGRLERWSGPIRGRAHEYFRLAPALEPRVTLDGARIEVRFESPAGDAAGARTADTAEVFRAWREGESLVPLLGGGWAPLPADWLARHGERVADLLAAREAGGTVPRCCLPDLLGLYDELDEPAPPDLGPLRGALSDFESIPAVEPPSDLATSLRSYQRRGVDWLVFLRDLRLGALLADDMGLGKTIQALCAIRGRTLVVTPTSVLHNWADEVRRHRPRLRCAIYHGPSRKLDAEADVTLTTYALLRLDADSLGEIEWEGVVLDEAQNIKNPESQVAEAAYRLRAGFKLALTGTPVENRLDELWSQFHFINRGLLGGRSDFRRRYADPIARGDGDTARRFRERIRPFVLRRLKSEVLTELPPRTEMVLHCELSPEERSVYETVHAATRAEIVERLRTGGDVMAALEALLRLRQAACHAGLVPGAHADSSSKLELLMESLDSVVADGHKAVVFSQWTTLLDLAEPLLRAASVDFTRLDGSTRDRAGVVRAFQHEQGPPVMLVSLRAGGTGLNLTAADHVFLLDPWWNPAVEDQAADRTHRIGQRRPVMVYRLVAEDTVEERILALQQRKRELADAALSDATRAPALTRDDLMELLR